MEPAVAAAAFIPARADVFNPAYFAFSKAKKIFGEGEGRGIMH